MDPSTFTSWVPGLRRTRVIALDEARRPREIQFEFATSRTYTLTYAYSDEHEMHWEPRLGRRDAVSGFARVEASDQGTNLTYGLEHGAARSKAENELGDLQEVVASFVRWMQR